MKTHLSNIEDKLDDTLKKIDSFRYKKLLEAKAPSQSIEDEIRITNKDNEQVILSISQLDDYKSIIGELIVGDYNTSEEETQRALKLLKDKLARSQGKPIETKNPTDEGETPEAELEPKEEIEETFEEDSLIDEPITDEVNLFSEIENQEENKASFLLGKQLFENESYEMALAELQKYRNDNPEGRHYLEATFYIGQAFKKLKMPIEAKIFFQEIIKTNADSRWAMKVKKEMTE